MRPDLFHDHREAGRIGQVGVVETKPLVSRRIAQKVVDSLAIQAAGTPDQAVHLVVGLAEKEFGKV